MKIAHCLTRHIFLTAIILLAGCATHPPLQTPSGRPEVSIHGATKKDILDMIVSQMLNDGWRKKYLKANSVVVVRPTDKWEMILTYGSPTDSIPENQVMTTGIAGGLMKAI